MNKELLWIPYFESGKEMNWVKNNDIQQKTKHSVNKIIKEKKYTNTIHKIGSTIHIGIKKEQATNGNTIVHISMNVKKENKMDILYRFTAGLHPGWKIGYHKYENDTDNKVKSIHGVQVRYIQKTDKNNGGARFAIQERLITGFGYFIRYLGLDFSHEELVGEIKHALIYLDV